jgi:hypothetical protein
MSIVSTHGEDKRGVQDSQEGSITLSDLIPNKREVTKQDIDDYVGKKRKPLETADVVIAPANDIIGR